MLTPRPGRVHWVITAPVSRDSDSSSGGAWGKHLMADETSASQIPHQDSIHRLTLTLTSVLLVACATAAELPVVRVDVAGLFTAVESAWLAEQQANVPPPLTA